MRPFLDTMSNKTQSVNGGDKRRVSVSPALDGRIPESPQTPCGTAVRPLSAHQASLKTVMEKRCMQPRPAWARSGTIHER